MNLKVIGTGSKGNAYLLYNEEEALLIECGVKFKYIQQAIDFDIRKIVGCIVTHEHMDHCKSINDVMRSGINVYATEGTHEALSTIKHHRARTIQYLKTFNLGNFKIMPFEVKHDAVQPCGFIIKHDEIGNTLFLTDSYYSPYRFANLNNIIIEANYSQDIIDKKLEMGGTISFVRNRVLESHMSIDNCIGLFDANDMSKVNNIVLIHLSDSNSDEALFYEKIKSHTLKTTTVARNGMDIPLNKTPF